MRAPAAVDVRDRFEPERAALLELLQSLRAEQWNSPTICAGWSVKDIASHLVGDDMAILSRWRDGFAGASFAAHSWDELVAEINRRNEAWVVAMRRLSPALIVGLLRWLAQPTLEAFRDHDAKALGDPVSWAGPDPAPGWLHVAREYTERWHHQQQIREAAGAALLKDPAFLGPVLATFARALPRAFGAVEARFGTQVGIDFAGAAGSQWAVVRESGGWTLHEGPADRPEAVVTIGEDAAWRLFTRGLAPDATAKAISVAGDRSWARPLFGAVAILA